MSKSSQDDIFNLEGDSSSETSPLLPTTNTARINTLFHRQTAPGPLSSPSPQKSPSGPSPKSLLRRDSSNNLNSNGSSHNSLAGNKYDTDIGAAFSFHNDSHYLSSTPRASTRWTQLQPPPSGPVFFSNNSINNNQDAPIRQRSKSVVQMSMPELRSATDKENNNRGDDDDDDEEEEDARSRTSPSPIRITSHMQSPAQESHYRRGDDVGRGSLSKSLPRQSLPNIAFSPSQPTRHQPSSPSLLTQLPPPAQSMTTSDTGHRNSEGFESSTADDDENDEGGDEDWFRINEMDFTTIQQHIMAAGLQTPRKNPVATGSPKLRPTTFTKRAGNSTPHENLLRKTGVLKSNSFEALDFAKFDQPISEILRQSAFWIDVTLPTHEELGVLCRLFNIHPLTEEDIEADETREKCEVFRNYYFVVFRTFEQHEVAFLKPIQMFIVVFRECVLSFHHRPVPHTFNVLKRIEQLRPYGMTLSPDWISYAIIDDITDSFQPLLRYTELEVDTIDDLVLILKESEQSDMLQRVGMARKNVNQLMRLLATKPDVLKTIIKRCGERVAPGSETVLYLGDIQDHILTMLQNVFHYEATLSRSHSNYLASITIELTQASNKTNDVVMRMTALASVLVPLNVITGLWGMNVLVPGQGQESLYWFFAIVSAMIVISGTSFYLVRRHHVI
ncbi:hypothetical protein SmJEL517_g02389 [Synchytrium microbalum]|uniref:Magnesium transporter n=1 Tax=Synchytrium microbalum TaxID=1806994 RepID=A0A507CB07_9FUNG|nr:uncharacterized protein SmJEL517_g02389 [Synchytrium microbalum]TPX35134.1 hypothetical protein SmJEL517_g02389 [Synchytrium microbalum]